MPVRAIGRTNAGMFSSRASAAAVHWTGIGCVGSECASFPGVPAVALAEAGIMAAKGQPEAEVPASVVEASADARPRSGPMRTPSDCTTCVSYALVSIAIS